MLVQTHQQHRVDTALQEEGVTGGGCSPARCDIPGLWLIGSITPVAYTPACHTV